jgi:hypothetical protein
MTGLLATSFFVLGFFLRAVRLWVVLHRTGASFLLVFLALCVSTVVSFVTGIAWFGELLKWGLLAVIARRAWVSAGFSLVYTRLFDFTLFSIAWVVLNKTFGGMEFGVLLSGVVVFFILVGLVLLPAILQRLRHYVFSSVRSSNALVMLKGLNRFEFEFDQLRLTRPYLLFTMGVLTVGIWCCEILSVVFLLDNVVSGQLPKLVLQILMTHFSTVVSSVYSHVGVSDMIHLEGVWNNVMIGLTLSLVAVTIVWKGVKRVWRS